jgi:hypothetical protein
MDLTSSSFLLSILAIILAVYSIFKPNNQNSTAAAEGFKSMPLRLQAYERLVLLTERISLPNLISRLNQPGISVQEMKLILTENIKQEFEHNSTQQLYVSQVGWDAVRSLKEQNIMIIHKIAATLQPDASASELNRKLMEVLISQPNIAMHELVLQTLNLEAKKIMN